MNDVNLTGLNQGHPSAHHSANMIFKLLTGLIESGAGEGGTCGIGEQGRNGRR